MGCLCIQHSNAWSCTYVLYIAIIKVKLKLSILFLSDDHLQTLPIHHNTSRLHDEKDWNIDQFWLIIKKRIPKTTESVFLSIENVFGAVYFGYYSFNNAFIMDIIKRKSRPIRKRRRRISKTSQDISYWIRSFLGCVFCLYVLFIVDVYGNGRTIHERHSQLYWTTAYNDTSNQHINRNFI